ncbi:hypothetical protein OG21DRAFT_1512134 [Imleria badia]|nr:hypothetical protein OG21DRAFT_1512134 [Imleria badia]
MAPTTAFTSGIDKRDMFLGKPRCIICGNNYPLGLQHCHISRESEPDTWADLKRRGWIPTFAKDAEKEPRNGVLMCANHHLMFDTYGYFIRFLPHCGKFIFVNQSNSPYDQQFHGKAIGLDICHRLCPFPSLFIIHEMRVRGFYPFQLESTDHPPGPVAGDAPWQDWMLADGVINRATGTIIRDSPHSYASSANVATHSPHCQPGGYTQASSLALTPSHISHILCASQAMPSWKACQIAGVRRSWQRLARFR